MTGLHLLRFDSVRLGIPLMVAAALATVGCAPSASPREPRTSAPLPDWSARPIVLPPPGSSPLPPPGSAPEPSAGRVTDSGGLDRGFSPQAGEGAAAPSVSLRPRTVAMERASASTPWWVDRVLARPREQVLRRPPKAPSHPKPQRRPKAPRSGSLVNDTFADFHEVEPFLTGVASWYGPRFHGKPTASGEVYNQYAFTAAHPNLPMGTRILVRNTQNGRRVYLRVNDRGPYKKGRVLDLSYVAAQHLGVLKEGTAPVMIMVVQWPKHIEPRLGLRAYRQFVVQIASRPQADAAKRIMDSMQRRMDWTSLRLDQPPGSNYTVIAGPFDTRRQANWVARRMQRGGVTSFVRSYRK